MDTAKLLELHAAKRFDYRTLGSPTRALLRRTSLHASADGTIGGLTVNQVDAEFESAGITGREALAAKLELSNKGIMLPL
jgi:hypothetical protein